MACLLQKTLPILIGLLMVLIKSQSTQPPNVLFMLVDDLGWTDISHNGAEYQTPNIDALYASGIELSNYYVHLDCSPTRSAVLTGKYAWKTGLQNIQTVPPFSTQHIPFDTPTVAELMKSAGYNTHGLGKWHLGYASWNMTPIERGFDSYFGYFQGEQFYYNHTMQVPAGDEAMSGYDFWDDRDVYREAVGVYSTELYTERLVKILDGYGDGADSSPFFVYMAWQTVHTPIEAPPKSYTQCDGISNPMRKIYCNKMLYLDEAIGTIVSTLKAKGLYDNTLIALSTDNGGMPYWLNQNTPYVMALSWGCNLPLRAGKATLFEGGVKGVGLLSGALIEKSGLAGTSNDILSHASDWLVTFVEGVAKKELPRGIDFDGKNILNALGENAAGWNRTELYLNIDNEGGDLFALIFNETATHTTWKYIRGAQAYTNYYYCNQTAFGPDNLTETEWLFNLTANPYEYEEENLVRQYPDKVKQLNDMIQQQIDNGGYVPDQSRQAYAAGFPEAHHGVMAPWLS